MGSTRNHVLQHLLTQQRCTINDLAQAVKINPISVRHHITKLENDGLVDSAEERHGVGRPRRVYFLTEAGMELFPGRTIHFTNKLLDQLKSQLSAEAYNKLFDKMAASISDNYLSEADFDSLTLDQRLDLIENWLTNEGYTVQVERNAQEIVIKESSCPYYYVGQTHEEVCTIDKRLIAKVLSADPERTSCLLSGDSHCTYVVPLSAIKENITI
ncbi:MAG: winged helix-turn-helix transcriptional regulator [Chloroflexi bacterium]|nr:winged helix-turn-helix transcriptional regulator [Chloroflexota bacterium]